MENKEVANILLPQVIFMETTSRPHRALRIGKQLCFEFIQVFSIFIQSYGCGVYVVAFMRRTTINDSVATDIL